MFVLLLVLAACTSAPVTPAPTSTTTPTPTLTPASSLTIPPEVTQYSREWPLPNRDYSNTRASLDSAVNSSNVNNLQVAWNYVLGKGGGASTPIIAGNTVYFEDLQSNVVALDLPTGKVKWQQNYSMPVLGPNGLAIGWGKVFACKGYYDLAALDASSGQELWSTTLSTKDTVAVLIQPSVFDNRVYVATTAGGTGKPNPGGGIGTLYTLDQATGKVVWSLDMAPADLWGIPRSTMEAALTRHRVSILPPGPASGAHQRLPRRQGP